MEHTLTDREKYQAAKSHVAKLKGFYIHAGIFAAVMTGLIALDYAKGGVWWVQWPLIGWGLGLLGHAYLTFAPTKRTGPGWEERKIRETMKNM